MPGARLPMRKIRNVLGLSGAGMSKRKIAASLGVSATAAGECIRRARCAGLAWPLPEELSDEALEGRLFPPLTVAQKAEALKTALAGQVLSSAAAPCLGCPFQTISHMMTKLLKHRAICLELRVRGADALRCHC
jgi:hypothetical protein